MFESRLQVATLRRKVRQALDFSIEVSDLIDRHHPNLVPINGPHVAVAVASFMQSLDHRNSVILLVAHGARSSAAAMIRPIFEAYYRGIWALKVAKKAQIQEIFGDFPRIPTLDAVLQQLRKNEETSALAGYDSWKVAGDYVHSGPLQLSRWLSHNSIEPLHPDSDVLDMLELSDFCGLLTAIAVNEACERDTSELNAKLTEHTLRRGTRQTLRAYYGSDDPVLPEIKKIATALAQIAKSRTEVGRPTQAHVQPNAMAQRSTSRTIAP